MTTHDRDKIDAAITAATNNWTEDTTFIERLYSIAFEAGRLAEREECALICDSHADDPVYCGEAIRGRSMK